MSFALFSVGWMMFGLATYRARVFPRWSAVVLVVGGALGYLVGFPPFGMVLAVGVGIVGMLALRFDRFEGIAPTHPVPSAPPVVEGSAAV